MRRKQSGSGLQGAQTIRSRGKRYTMARSYVFRYEFAATGWRPGQGRTGVAAEELCEQCGHPSDPHRVVPPRAR
jgi:hypothetical protein